MAGIITGTFVNYAAVNAAGRGLHAVRHPDVTIGHSNDACADCASKGLCIIYCGASFRTSLRSQQWDITHASQDVLSTLHLRQGSAVAAVGPAVLFAGSRHLHKLISS